MAELLFECATCDGSGRVENDAESMWAPMWRTCPTCEGDGRVELKADPFLEPVDEPNILDTVDPAWGLPAGHPDYPARVADQVARTQAGAA